MPKLCQCVYNSSPDAFQHSAFPLLLTSPPLPHTHTHTHTHARTHARTAYRSLLTLLNRSTPVKTRRFWHWRNARPRSGRPRSKPGGSGRSPRTRCLASRDSSASQAPRRSCCSSIRTRLGTRCWAKTSPTLRWMRQPRSSTRVMTVRGEKSCI